MILKNIQNSDFLFVDMKFDIIFGNPPYVRIQNLETDYVDKLKKLDLNLDETSLWGQDVNVQVSGDLIEVQVHHLPIRYIKKDKIEDVVKFIEENI